MPQLTETQIVFLRRCLRGAYYQPYTAYDSPAEKRSWLATANRLASRGLIVIRDSDGLRSASLTDSGEEALAQVSK